MKISLLIADKDESVHRFLRNAFIKDGFTIHSVFSAEEALMVISSHQIDFVISELEFPAISGIILLNKIKKLAPSIEFIFYAEHTSLESAVLALRGGASDYISKTVEKDKIVLSLRALIKKHRNNNIYNSSKNQLISKSISMIKVMELVNQVSNSNATIMLNGETGTGKSVMAEIIHKLSSRNKKALIKVNCAAIPEQLLESELFGYEKGAFTGAGTTKPGRFELADGGTLFLDEIGDISPFMQVKLLRVLQEKEFEHLGGIKTIKVDVRVITATNKDLVQMVKNGTFREDLYYRLNVVPISLPPLRERKEDIVDLVNHFLIQLSRLSISEIKTISKDALDKLVNYYWPGNIRELENVIERCTVITPGSLITLDNLPSNIVNYTNNISTKEAASSLISHRELSEKETIVNTLETYNNNVTKAAEALSISRRTLHRKINKYNIDI